MSKPNSHYAKLRNSEAGMVSIMVTMVLIIVISLIVLGFAQIARRNQRQALDQHLSTQAFYAAESGVNDVIELIKNAVNNGDTVYEKPDCTNGSGGAAAFYSSLNPTLSAGIQYSCVIVDPSPTELRYNDVGTDSLIVPLIAQGGSINAIRLTWQAKGAGNPMTGCPSNASTLPATGSWNCGYGVLRFDLVPTSGSGLNIDNLANNVMTTFAVPVTAGSTSNIGFTPGYTGANNRIGANCNTTQCSLQINSGLGGGQYHMRISSLYKGMSLQVTAADGSGNPVQLIGAQAVIDSTGRAQDVLRRIRVNAPLLPASTNALPEGPLTSTDSLCKRYAIMQGYFTNDIPAGISGGRLCNP